MKRQRFSPTVAICLLLALLFLIPEDVHAGFFGRCGKRRIFFRCRPNWCQRCSPCQTPQEAEGAPRARMMMASCAGQVCLNQEIARYYQGQTCLYATYMAEQCYSGYIYVDEVCDHALDTCANCQNCISGGAFGETPLLGAAKTSIGRRFRRTFANSGTAGNITSVQVVSPDYDFQRVGVYSVRLQNETQPRIVELYWIHQRRDVNSGFGVGIQLPEGQPQNELQGQQVGPRGFTGRVGEKRFVVYFARDQVDQTIQQPEN